MAPRGRVTRDHILEQAHALLETGRYSAFKVEALAKNLEMSKSTLYKHFRGKDEIVTSLVDSACRSTEIDLRSAAAIVDAVSALRQVGVVYAAHGARLPRALWVQRERLPGACRDRLDGTDLALRRALQTVVTRGATLGSLRSAEPAVAAAGLAAGACASLTAAADRSPLLGTRADAVRAWVELGLRGLAP